MQSRVSPYSNHVHIPTELMRRLGWRRGDKVKLAVKDGQLIVGTKLNHCDARFHLMKVIKTTEDIQPAGIYLDITHVRECECVKCGFTDTDYSRNNIDWKYQYINEEDDCNGRNGKESGTEGK